jgi:hypothetical protein
MALFEYDPDEHIVSAAWLALDESERMRLVKQYHRQQRVRPGGSKRCREKPGKTGQTGSDPKAKELEYAPIDRLRWVTPVLAFRGDVLSCDQFRIRTSVPYWRRF